ncbi:MAG: acetylornithine deacetylase [Alphaproteobacteria bacterium]|nr:acetylornithine deacetylase [Alphaproteobacteria bacterium]
MPESFTPRRMLDRLVAFDTTSRDSNLQLIEFVRGYLGDYGIETTLIPDETGKKANLFATLGPARDDGIVLSGHTDVVPVDGQPWSSDPFRTAERDGKLYGRGTCDMKGFIATCLALVPEFLARRLPAPLHFAFSYDEEVGCIGVHGIVAHLKTLGFRPKAVIVGEPTEMRVVNAHKGMCGIDTLITGLEAHSSQQHKGVNAIVQAGRLIAYLAELQERLKREGPHDHRFDPPYTTIDIGVVEGGTARNIIPREAKLRWGYRALPGSDDGSILAGFQRYAEDRLLPEMHRVDKAASIESRMVVNAAGLAPREDSPAQTLAMSLAGANQTEAAAYCTEAGTFQAAGIPTIVCGPGNIREAHKPDEYLELSQLDLCADFLRRLADRLAAGQA